MSLLNDMELAIISDEIALDLEVALQHGKSLGFRKFEIRCLGDYEHRIPNIEEDAVDRLESLVREGKIEIPALSPGTFKIKLSETEALRREMEDVLPRSCELARRFQCPRLITFGFMFEDGGSRDEAVDRLREAGRIAADYGLQLSVENEPGSYCDTGVATAALVRKINMDHVGINWDPANGVYAGEAAWPVGYEAVRPLIQNVHIKDGIPLPGGKWENRLLGDGGVNWIGQLAAFMRDQPVAHYTLETHVFPLLESTKEDLRRLKILTEAASHFTASPS